jgi:phage shock protein A
VIGAQLDTQQAALQGRLDEINARIDSLKSQLAALQAEKQQIKADLDDINSFRTWKAANP